MTGKTKEQICKDIGVSEKTFERFKSTLNGDVGKVEEGSAHIKTYTDDVVSKFKEWLKKNQLSQGKACGSKDLINSIRGTVHTD